MERPWQQISTDLAYRSSNPLCQAVACRTPGLLFVSGQLGIRPGERSPVEGGVRAETRQIFQNAREILAAAGLAFDDVVKTTIFVTALKPEELAEVNAEYRAHIVEPFPARSLVGVAWLNLGCTVEIEFVAALR